MTIEKTCPSDLEWIEERTQYFSVIYPEQNEELIQQLFSEYGDQLDSEYSRFSDLFNTSLSVPPSIRVYPTEDFYYCLNALPPPLNPSDTHAHVGSYEIALIEENIQADLVKWGREALDNFRYGLAVLFLKQTVEGEIPPGLEYGVGAYTQDPTSIFQNRYLTTQARNKPLKSWSFLWESGDTEEDPVTDLQVMSIIAYLVDVHGWPAFLQFLENLSTNRSYRKALAASYDVDFKTLEEQWRLYYPFYLDGRWRAHVIYGFDLSAFEELLAAGAYADALKGLKGASEFLEKMGETAKLDQVQTMIDQAQMGLEADALANQTRQALQEGEYQLAIEIAKQAQGKYEQLNDQRRLAELYAYRSRAQEVLDLRAELKGINQDLTLENAQLHVERLKEIGHRLGELGDEQSEEMVRETLASLLEGRLNEVEEQKELLRDKIMRAALIGVSISVLLLAHRIWVVRRPPPAETQLF